MPVSQHPFPPPSCVIRLGMSLVEAIIAVAVLATGICGALSMIDVMSKARRQVSEEEQVQKLVQSVVARLQTESWTSLGTSSTAAATATGSVYSAPRFFNLAAGGNGPPLTETATNPRDNLVALGFIPKPTGVRNLAIYIEYYRAVTFNGNPGLMDRTYAQVGDFRTWFQNSSNRATVRIGPPTASFPPTAAWFTEGGYIGEDDPVSIRVFATWGDAASRKMEVFLSRNR